LGFVERDLFWVEAGKNMGVNGGGMV
jgi:hypothetical protein